MEGCCSEKSNSSCCGASKPKATQVSTKLTVNDRLGSWKVRWGINRMNFKVEPGLYCVGNPDESSQVLVTGNYKMSFDVLRRELTAIDAWILVLDTKGVNVWCAAGKGTFGTEELINRIEKSALKQFVTHRTVILPQLGAVGVSAHEVQKRSGFKVVYGPVRAEDVPKFLKAGLKADSEMRTVRFTIIDRAVLTPIEIVAALKPSLIIFGIMFLLNLIGLTEFSATEVNAYVVAVLAGGVLAPLILPWIPVRAFALKGWILGLLWTIYVIAVNGWIAGTIHDVIISFAYLLILPSVSAYCAMNFTGASTYTSLSGVLKEMKIAVPLIVGSIVIGVILLLVGNVFIR